MKAGHFSAKIPGQISAEINTDGLASPEFIVEHVIKVLTKRIGGAA